MQKKMIYSLQSWRAIFILAIFIEHLGMSNWIGKFFSGGAEGVAFFIMLSGFVMGLTYYDRLNDFSLGAQIVFVKKKISQFYPLHFITLCLAVPLSLISFYQIGSMGFKEFGVLIKQIVVNIFLVQSFIPSEDYFFSLNGLAWYLSTTAFFYLVTYLIFKVIKKFLTNSKRIGAALICLLAVHLVIVTLLKDSTYFVYFTYIFPPFRCLEFIAGILFGILFLFHREKTFKYSSAYEILAVVAFLTYHLSARLHFVPVTSYNCTMRIILAVLVVTSFCNDSGILSKILSNRILVYMGNISFEFYIIHQIVIRYCKLFALRNYILIPLSLSITILLSIVAHNYIGKILITGKAKNEKALG